MHHAAGGGPQRSFLLSGRAGAGHCCVTAGGKPGDDSISLMAAGSVARGAGLRRYGAKAWCGARRTGPGSGRVPRRLRRTAHRSCCAGTRKSASPCEKCRSSAGHLSLMFRAGGGTQYGAGAPTDFRTCSQNGRPSPRGMCSCGVPCVIRHNGSPKSRTEAAAGSLSMPCHTLRRERFAPPLDHVI